MAADARRHYALQLGPVQCFCVDGTREQLRGDRSAEILVGGEHGNVGQYSAAVNLSVAQNRFVAASTRVEEVYQSDEAPLATRKISSRSDANDGLILTDTRPALCTLTMDQFNKWREDVSNPIVLLTGFADGGPHPNGQWRDAALDKLGSFQVLAWDGSLPKDTACGALVADFLRGKGRRAVAFVKASAAAKVKAAWAKEVEGLSPGQLSVVPMDIGAEVLRLELATEAHMVVGFSKDEQDAYFLGRVALKTTAAAETVAIGGPGIAAVLAEVSMDEGVNWTIFAVSRGVQERQPSLLDWASAAPRSRGVHLRFLRGLDPQEPLGYATGSPCYRGFKKVVHGLYICVLVATILTSLAGLWPLYQQYRETLQFQIDHKETSCSLCSRDFKNAPPGSLGPPLDIDASDVTEIWKMVLETPFGDLRWPWPVGMEPSWSIVPALACWVNLCCEIPSGSVLRDEDGFALITYTANVGSPSFHKTECSSLLAEQSLGSNFTVVYSAGLPDWLMVASQRALQNAVFLTLVQAAKSGLPFAVWAVASTSLIVWICLSLVIAALQCLFCSSRSPRKGNGPRLHGKSAALRPTSKFEASSRTLSGEASAREPLLRTTAEP